MRIAFAGNPVPRPSCPCGRKLSEYKVPSLNRAFVSMCSRGWAFIVKAGTVILVCNNVIQIMQIFNWSFWV
mgnify:CR=1 FL=1